MAGIDPTARIADGAAIGEGSTIGPFCMIGADVTIGPGSHLIGHVYVAGKTTIGANCTVHPFASLGGPPQSLAHRGDITQLEIGDGCTIRESATISAGSVAGGGVTRIGKRAFLMSCIHVGHDCQLGDDVIMASSASLGGHCWIGDFVFLGALAGVHQFTRIGAQAMIGGMTAVRGDVIPFGLVSGQPGRLQGLNIIGMKRRKFTRERLASVRAFYRALFHGPGVFADRLTNARDKAAGDSAIAEILAFIDAGKHREMCLPGVDAAA